MTLHKTTRLIMVVIGMMVLSGCIKYSFRGALPSNLKTIAIPLFADNSNWPGLQEGMTQSVIDGFISDNSLEVIENEDDADLLLKAQILSVSTRRSSVSATELVESEQMVVNVKVECINQLTDKALWKKQVSDVTDVSGSATLAEREAAVIEIMDKLVEDIVNGVISAW